MGAHGFALAQSMSFLQALDLARQNDPKYQMVRQDVLVRREQVAQAFAQFLPNVSLSYNRNDIDRNMLNSSAAPSSILSENKTFTIRQPLFRKALVGNHDKAKLMLEAAEYDFVREELELSVRTLASYLEILTVQELLVTNSAQLVTLRAQLDYAQQASVKGFTRKTDVLDARSRLSSLESDRMALQGRLSLGKTALFRLIKTEVQPLWKPSYARIIAQSKNAPSLQDWWSEHRRAALLSRVCRRLRRRRKKTLKSLLLDTSLRWICCFRK